MHWSRHELDRLDEALQEVRRGLLAARNPEGYWAGELSTSALSTATASFAMTLVSRELSATSEIRSARHRELARRGLEWLARHANADGGWGDTVRSRSNISTTSLCWAALSSSPEAARAHPKALSDAEDWLRRQAGSLDPVALASAITSAYGEDRTFSAPILAMCALAGRLGDGRQAWEGVFQLPFELAACPRSWFRFLGLRVVSYALPALIAVGQVRHDRLPTRNPLLRLLRGLAGRRALDVLDRIQPAGGGFLEATPLTSFVAMSLAGSGRADHPVVGRALDFLVGSVGKDGGWPIDTNLATWVTTLSVNGLAEAGLLEESMGEPERRAVLEWLLAQQYAEMHPYTHAAPGAWAWTDLPGGVPDADDTAGALIALRRLSPVTQETRDAAVRGLRWLVDLQNRDGGVPTFCRGWTKLYFDRSGADLTAHALRAFLAWREELEPSDRRLTAGEVDAALRKGVEYLRGTQRGDGSWIPMWFGNEKAPECRNPVYGTAKVLAALRECARFSGLDVHSMRAPARRWLLSAQSPAGGWGGAAGVEPSVEETALALDALSDREIAEDTPEVAAALQRGAIWLVDAVESGKLDAPTPIGFYFANLWYFERLYPLIFTLSALGRLKRCAAGGGERSSR